MHVTISGTGLFGLAVNASRIASDLLLALAMALLPLIAGSLCPRFHNNSTLIVVPASRGHRRAAETQENRLGAVEVQRKAPASIIADKAITAAKISIVREKDMGLVSLGRLSVATAGSLNFDPCTFARRMAGATVIAIACSPA